MRKTRLVLTALSATVSSFILFGATHAFAATKTWTGGGSGNNMTTGGNWGGSAPSAGDDLVFPANITKLTVTNDFTAATSFHSITFSGAATQDSNYTLSGNSMTLVAGITASMTGSFSTSPTIGFDIILNGTQTFDSGSGYIIFSGALDLGSSALTVTTTSSIALDGVVSGSTGSITKTGTGDLLLDGNNTFDGVVTVSAGRVAVGSQTGLGSATGATTVADGAALFFFQNSGDVTYAEPLTLNGTGTGSFSPTIGLGNSYGSGGGGYSAQPYSTSTFSGAITLGSDVVLGASERNGKITGAITGSHGITLADFSIGNFELASSANGSSTANGTLTQSTKETDYTADSSGTNISVRFNETAVVTGTYGFISVDPGATLKGTGTVGSALIGGTIAPGMSPGCLSTGDLTLYSMATYAFEIGGKTACSGYDQIKVTGGVTLDGTLDVSLYNKFKPVAGQKYVIIDNDSNDDVIGTFAGLAEGDTFKVNGYTYSISYKGGDGNDVELTVTAVAPDTGFALISNSPIVSLAVMTGAAGGIAIIARRTLKPAHARRRR